MSKEVWQKLKKDILYWGQIILIPFYGFSFLTPRKNDTWLFGSSFGNRFADNPKYLYLYLNQHPELGIKPVWITKNQEVFSFLKENGYPVFMKQSWKGFCYCLRAKIYVFDNYSKDISFWCSGGAIKINLWHGSGNKKTNFDNEFDLVRHPKNAWEKFKTFPRRLSDEKPHHYTLATSEAMAEIFVSAFHTTRDHIILDGYPRNDGFLNEEFKNLLNQKERKNLERINLWREQGNYLVFFMPTFRSSETEFFDTMDLDYWNGFLEEHKIKFVVKLHPKSKILPCFLEKEYSEIQILDPSLDPYTFIHKIDMLVTDYSSIYTDFMLLDKPVVAFPFDEKSYYTATRDEYIPAEEYMPEKRVYTMQSLERAILELKETDIFKPQRDVSRNRMFRYKDADSCKRITKKIRILSGMEKGADGGDVWK